jgi:hypothetical protein
VTDQITAAARRRRASSNEEVLSELELLARGRHPSQLTILEKYRQCPDWIAASNLLLRALSAAQRGRHRAPLEIAGRMVPADCLIASGRHMSVPRLRGVATRHQRAFGVGSAATLGRTLLEARIADANDWQWPNEIL